MNGKYDDMIHLPHPTSSRHPRMSMADRAAQFSPFAALTGHGAAISETARLTDRQRRVIELHFWQGYQYKEIAVIMCCSPVAVTQTMQRAFKQIRLHLQDR